MTREQLLARIRAAVRDKAGKLSAGDFDGYLDGAIVRVDARRPREVVVDLVAGGEPECALPEEWVDGFSQPRQLEYPVGSRPRSYLSRREYSVEATPEGPVLLFHDTAPAAGAAVRLTFTVPHQAETVPHALVEAVINLASGMACLALAAEYSEKSDQRIGADQVEHGSRSSEFDKRGRDYLRQAEADLPALTSTKETRAAAGESSYSADLDFLTHS